MTSTENGHDFDKIDMKTEINIDDEILFVNGTSLDDLQVLEPSSSVDKNLINGGIYFFEPQSIHITANNKRNDQKSEYLVTSVVINFRSYFNDSTIYFS